MCGAKSGGVDLAGVDLSKQAVIQGRVLKAGAPVAGAYVRLLDAGGEFTAEVPTSATGHFRFFAGDGRWTLRTLAPGASTDRAVVASIGDVAEVDVELEAA
jgi:protocatechuate 3,4-dioxygenase beta subunit